jgi:NAD+ synthase
MTLPADPAKAGKEPAVRFGRSVLDIDAAATACEIEEAIRRLIAGRLHRRGAVVAVSGGVDSAVCATLAARALGSQRVLGLLMPERDSAPDGTDRGKRLCEHLGIEYVIEDIAAVLEALGCYRRRDEAIRKLFPEYSPGYRQKIAVAENLLGRDRLNYFNLIIESPDGRREKQRMPLEVYLQVVAATNMKQRTRKLLEYYHAERLNYAVLGTPNRLEYDLGFFVRGGDGLADLKPIAHLYKTQVYSLAEYLAVPEEIRRQPPSTDTYSLPQTQEEFYFALPYNQMDLVLYALLHDVPADETGPALGLTAEQVQRVYRDIAAKQRTASRLLHAALLVPDARSTAENP